MPQYHRHLDVRQGYHHTKDVWAPVGFITRLQLDILSLPADQICKDPTRPTQDLAVVAVLSQVLWDTGITDALYFSGQISTFNRQTLARTLPGVPFSVEVVFQFAVYDYDPIAKKYFLSFHSNGTDMNGFAEKRADNVTVALADDASTEVLTPQNYTLGIGIEPQLLEQTLVIASADQRSIVKKWGLTVG